MKTLRLDVSRALSVEYHRTETWMLLCSACLGKLAGRGERKEREKVVYSRGKLKPTFIVANDPLSSWQTTPPVGRGSPAVRRPHTRTKDTNSCPPRSSPHKLAFDA